MAVDKAVKEVIPAAPEPQEIGPRKRFRCLDRHLYI